MDLGALQNSLAKAPPGPVWLIQGEEQWMVAQAVRIVVTAAVGTLDDPMLVTRVDLAEGKKGAREIVAACRSIGLFTSRVAVLVRSAELLDKRAGDKEELAKYCESPCPGATLVLKASENLDGRTTFMKHMAKHAKVLSYPLLKAWQAEKWLAERARQLGQRLARDAAQLVLELVGPGLMGLEQTLQQLSLFVGPGRPITRSDVESALAGTRAHSIFELVDAIAEKKSTVAIRHLDAMLDQREYPPLILAAIVRHFRQLVLAKAICGQGGRAADIQRELGVHEFVAGKLFGEVTRFDQATLRLAFEELFRAELELRSTRLDASLQLEALIMRLCPPPPATRRQPVHA